MRTSFLVALAASGLAAVVTVVVGWSWVSAASWLAAAACAGLWIAHLAAYALREARAAAADPTASLFTGRSSSAEIALRPRRAFLSLSIRAFAFAAVATMLPHSIALGQTTGAGDCKMKTCWETTCRCTYPTPVCVTCSARNESGCAAVDHIPCCSAAAFWLCPTGTTCNGDGTQTPYCR